MSRCVCVQTESNDKRPVRPVASPGKPMQPGVDRPEADERSTFTMTLTVVWIQLRDSRARTLRAGLELFTDAAMDPAHQKDRESFPEMGGSVGRFFYC